MSWLREAPHRLISIADELSDNDDARLRKRVGVIGGYVTIVGPLTLPIQADGHPLSWPLVVGPSLFSIGNLLVLARSGRFDRYVVALIAAGTVFVPLATWVGGGITGASSGLVWAFLVPAYAIMALGPHRAMPWFVTFLASVALMVAADPFVRDAIGTPPYPLQLLGQTQNAVVPLVITFLLLRYTDLGRRRAEARADELLTNALPASIAARLRRGETRIAEAYPDTTVLFADIVGFTRWTARTDPMRALALLDELFTAFDQAAASFGLEKIRTVGDSYMAVAGAPEPRADHAPAGLELARTILAAAADWRARNALDLQLRVGLASGPVVAGVIGQRRMLFDLWGETVNLAARMESSSLPRRIQVAVSSWSLLRNRYRFVAREVEAKGIGPMTAYLLEKEPAE